MPATRTRTIEAAARIPTAGFLSPGGLASGGIEGTIGDAGVVGPAAATRNDSAEARFSTGPNDAVEARPRNDSAEALESGPTRSMPTRHKKIKKTPAMAVVMRRVLKPAFCVGRTVQRR
jgi:hypothetical protein